MGVRVTMLYLKFNDEPVQSICLPGMSNIQAFRAIVGAYVKDYWRESTRTDGKTTITTLRNGSGTDDVIIIAIDGDAVAAINRDRQKFFEANPNSSRWGWKTGQGE